MPFRLAEVEQLLAECHRRCCVCHRFCGVKIETDHMDPAADGGLDDIDNAIPVCFECHADIHSYNDDHPRGRKFRPQELQAHKEQWLRICREQPDIFAQATRFAEVGPLQALIDELAFNAHVSQFSDIREQGCLFYDEQFRRAIERGAIATLKPPLQSAIVDAYVAMGRANRWIEAFSRHHPTGDAGASASDRAAKAIREATPKIAEAKDALLSFLGSEPQSEG